RSWVRVPSSALSPLPLLLLLSFLHSPPLTRSCRSPAHSNSGASDDAGSVKEIFGDIERWRRRGERFALATVVATRRSAPRPPGAKLAVSSGGELAGSVSGGCVESEVYGVAQDVLGGAESRLLTYGISDDLALEVGLPCGGEIDVFVEEADPELVDCLRRVLEDEQRAVLFTVVEGEGVGDRWLAVEGEETTAPVELAAEAGAFFAPGEARCWSTRATRSSQR